MRVADLIGLPPHHALSSPQLGWFRLGPCPVEVAGHQGAGRGGRTLDSAVTESPDACVIGNAAGHGPGEAVRSAHGIHPGSRQLADRYRSRREGVAEVLRLFPLARSLRTSARNLRHDRTERKGVNQMVLSRKRILASMTAAGIAVGAMAGGGAAFASAASPAHSPASVPVSFQVGHGCGKGGTWS